MAQPGNPGTPQKVTLKFLSERLGLSPSTISLALNKSADATTIAPETREIILKAAKKYNYKPNCFARYLQQQRSYLVGIVTPDMMEGYVSEIFSAVEEQLLKTEYRYFVTSHQWSRKSIQKTVGLFLERGAEGIILINTPLDFEVNVPVISIGKSTASKHEIVISIDNEAGIRCALDHLVSLGHRKIAFMKGHKGSADTEERWRAITKAAKSLSLEVDPKLLVRLERASVCRQISALEEGAACASELMSRSSDFTALVAFNDMAAIGAMHKFRDSGLRVPEDISVVGFDDVLAARIAYPQLTTVRQPLQEMGECAARDLIECIENGTQKRRDVVMSPELVIRKSTATASPRTAGA